jgi:hypothetical protein
MQRVFRIWRGWGEMALAKPKRKEKREKNRKKSREQER